MSNDDLVSPVAEYIAGRMRRSLATDANRPSLIAQAGAPNNYAGLDITLHWTNHWRDDSDLFSVTYARHTSPTTCLMDPNTIVDILNLMTRDEDNIRPGPPVLDQTLVGPVLVDMVQATDRLIATVNQLAAVLHDAATGTHRPLPAPPAIILAPYLTMGGLAQ